MAQSELETISKTASVFSTMLSPTALLVLLLSLIGTAHSDPTDLLWPLPNNHAVGTDMYTVDPKQFTFSPAGAGAGSDILKDAMARYMKLIFLPPPMESIGSSVSGALEKLTITVDSADESLQLDTNNSCMCRHVNSYVCLYKLFYMY